MRTACKQSGAFDAVLSKHWALGGEGAIDLAKALYAATEQGSSFKFLYDLGIPLKDKIEIISKEMYGAGEIVYSKEALEKLQQYEEQVRICRIHWKCY